MAKGKTLSAVQLKAKALQFVSDGKWPCQMCKGISWTMPVWKDPYVELSCATKGCYEKIRVPIRSLLDERPIVIPSRAGMPSPQPAVVGTYAEGTYPEGGLKLKVLQKASLLRALEAALAVPGPSAEVIQNFVLSIVEEKPLAFEFKPFKPSESEPEEPKERTIGRGGVQPSDFDVELVGVPLIVREVEASYNMRSRRYAFNLLVEIDRADLEREALLRKKGKAIREAGRSPGGNGGNGANERPAQPALDRIAGLEAVEVDLEGLESESELGEKK